MSIESKIPIEEINVKDLSLQREEYKEAYGFDIDKEISDAWWKNFEGEAQWTADSLLTHPKNKDRFIYCTNMLSYMKRIRPETEVWKYTNPAIEDGITDELTVSLGLSENFGKYLEMRNLASFVYPEGIEKVKANRDTVSTYRDLLREQYVHKKIPMETLITQLSQINTFLDKPWQPEEFNDFFQSDFLSQIEECLKSNSDKLFTIDDWVDFTDLLANANQIYPGGVDKLLLGDGSLEPFWPKLLQKYHDYEKYGDEEGTEFFKFAHLTANLNTISCTPIRFTENGRKLNMKKKRMSQDSLAPSLPEAKKF